jgi:hypothetical protein
MFTLLERTKRKQGRVIISLFALPLPKITKEKQGTIGFIPFCHALSPKKNIKKQGRMCPSLPSPKKSKVGFILICFLF